MFACLEKENRNIGNRKIYKLLVASIVTEFESLLVCVSVCMFFYFCIFVLVDPLVGPADPETNTPFPPNLLLK